jgi:tetratricopeptide (TPR) repeat protein
MASLAGYDIVVHGSLPDISRRRLAAAVTRRGGRLSPRPGRKTTHIVITHASANRDWPDWAVPDGTRLISELTFRRLLGLAPEPEPEPRSFTLADVAARCRLAASEAECLALFDVIEGVDDRYGFRDLTCAREAARLLSAGVDLHEIIQAATLLRRAGRRLGAARIVRAPWGGLVQEAEGQYVTLDGQFALDLGDEAPDLEALVVEAEDLAEEGELEAAERLYRIAMTIDRLDPVLPFNLGNLRHAAGDPAGAVLAFRQALARDPGFADAWYNLGVLMTRSERDEEAQFCYRCAVDAEPTHADALHNLALLLTRDENWAAALPRWEALLRLDPDPQAARIIRRQILLCRMGLASLSQAGDG